MRFYSTPQSAKDLEVSYLAIIETIAAVSFSIWLAISYLGTWYYVLAGACVAPLLLLKTDFSCQLAIKNFLQCSDEPTEDLEQEESLSFNAAVLMVFASPFIFFLIRVGSTIVGVLKHPLITIAHIPNNWMQICMCTDSFHVPELLPGIETSEGAESSGILFRNVFNLPDTPTDDKLKPDLAERAGELIVLIPAVLIVFTASYLYRFSLKSTSIVWLPLLWIIPRATPKSKLITRLAVINKSSWGRLISVASTIVLVLFAFKIVIFTGTNELNEWLSGNTILSKLSMFIEPHSIPRWQVASALNSLIALGLFWFASNRLIHFETGELKESEENTAIDYTLRTANVIRATLSVYTISCLFYIVLYNALLFDLPPLGDKFFPWN